MTVINYLLANQGILFGVLFGVSEALSFIPAINGNGIFQVVYNFLKSKKPSA